MIDYVNKNDKHKLAGVKGFNDEAQREAFIKMCRSGGCPILRGYIQDYFKMEDDKDYIIKKDPLGEYKVDLGIKCEQDNKLIGLIEVDYFKKWELTWPSNYKFCNRLLRKEKYYMDNPQYPYINITFNVSGTDGIFTTKEIEQKYPITEWFVPEVQKMEKGRRVLIKDAVKVGKWAA